MLSGVDREFDGRYRNPLSLLLLANQYGLGADGNVLLGARRALAGARPHHARRRSSAIDDLQYENTSGRDPLPQPVGASRWPASARSAARSAGAHSTPRRRAWPSARSTRSRTSPTRASGSAATSTTWTSSRCTVSVPRGARWLLTPELTLLRQGEGEINDPFPATPDEAGQIPTALHRRGRAHLARGARPARPRRARSICT